ncbi:hypothetical protein AAZX31_15G212400 [Glycine max]
MGSEKVEEDTEAAIFYSKKLPFLSDFYAKRFVSFVSLSTCSFSLFLCFCIFLFRSSPFIFLHILFSVSLFLQLTFSFVFIPLHIPFYSYFYFSSIFVYLAAC